jgi:hypothetical protein
MGRVRVVDRNSDLKSGAVFLIDHALSQHIREDHRVPDFPVVILFGLAHNTPLHDPVLESIKADLRVLLARALKMSVSHLLCIEILNHLFFLARAISPDRWDVSRLSV